MTTTTETWEPGVPLHPPPRGVFADQQHIRPLYDLLSDSATYVWWFIHSQGWPHLCRCIPCLVAWHPSQGKKCWSCGTEVTDTEYRRARSRSE